MAMEEEDIEKTAFRTGSSGLYEFTSHALWTNQRGHVLLQTHGNVHWGPAIRYITFLSRQYLHLRGNS